MYIWRVAFVCSDGGREKKSKNTPLPAQMYTGKKKNLSPDCVAPHLESTNDDVSAAPETLATRGRAQKNKEATLVLVWISDIGPRVVTILHPAAPERRSCYYYIFE